MKIETAIKVLEKEQEFLGIGLLELLQDIQKHGRMVYSERVVEAFDRCMIDGRRLFSSE